MSQSPLPPPPTVHTTQTNVASALPPQVHVPLTTEQTSQLRPEDLGGLTIPQWQRLDPRVMARWAPDYFSHLTPERIAQMTQPQLRALRGEALAIVARKLCTAITGNAFAQLKVLARILNVSLTANRVLRDKQQLCIAIHDRIQDRYQIQFEFDQPIRGQSLAHYLEPQVHESTDELDELLRQFAALMDPITREIMITPVTTLNGTSYDMDTLLQWTTRQHRSGQPLTDPLGRTVLNPPYALPNRTLRQLLHEMLLYFLGISDVPTPHPELWSSEYAAVDLRTGQISTGVLPLVVPSLQQPAPQLPLGGGGTDTFQVDQQQQQPVGPVEQEAMMMLAVFAPTELSLLFPTRVLRDRTVNNLVYEFARYIAPHRTSLDNLQASFILHQALREVIAELITNKENVANRLLPNNQHEIQQLNIAIGHKLEQLGNPVVTAQDIQHAGHHVLRIIVEHPKNLLAIYLYYQLAHLYWNALHNVAHMGTIEQYMQRIDQYMDEIAQISPVYPQSMIQSAQSHSLDDIMRHAIRHTNVYLSNPDQRSRAMDDILRTLLNIWSVRLMRYTLSVETIYALLDAYQKLVQNRSAIIITDPAQLQQQGTAMVEAWRRDMDNHPLVFFLRALVMIHVDRVARQNLELLQEAAAWRAPTNILNILSDLSHYMEYLIMNTASAEIERRVEWQFANLIFDYEMLFGPRIQQATDQEAQDRYTIESDTAMRDALSLDVTYPRIRSLLSTHTIIKIDHQLQAIAQRMRTNMRQTMNIPDHELRGVLYVDSALFRVFMFYYRAHVAISFSDRPQWLEQQSPEVQNWVIEHLQIGGRSIFGQQSYQDFIQQVNQEYMTRVNVNMRQLWPLFLDNYLSTVINSPYFNYDIAYAVHLFIDRVLGDAVIRAGMNSGVRLRLQSWRDQMVDYMQQQSLPAGTFIGDEDVFDRMKTLSLGPSPFNILSELLSIILEHVEALANRDQPQAIASLRDINAKVHELRERTRRETTAALST